VVKKVSIEVVSQKGTCDAGHRVGQKFTLGSHTPEGICTPAFVALYPTARALSAGGSFPWANEDGSLDIACGDADNPVVFRLKAID